jgi:hypothetical protein
MGACLYLATDLKSARVVSHDALADTTERHRLEVSAAPMTACADPLGELSRMPHLLGIIVEMERGWPGQSHLRFAAKFLRRKRRVWFYWPKESAIECIDRERLQSYWRL